MSESVVLAICTVACACLAGTLAILENDKWAGRVTWMFLGMTTAYVTVIVARSLYG